MEEPSTESNSIYDDFNNFFNLLEDDHSGFNALEEALNYDCDKQVKEGLMKDLSADIIFDDSELLCLTTPSLKRNDYSLPSCVAIPEPTDEASTSTSECMITISEDTPLLDEADDVVTVISPIESNDTSPPIKKRGRKPKSETGLATLPAKRKRRPRPKKTKKYEIDTPFDDEEAEKRRINAVNAKKYRDHQKKTKESLQQKHRDLIIEKEILQMEAEDLRKRVTLLEQQVEAFKRTAAPLMALVDVGP